MYKTPYAAALLVLLTAPLSTPSGAQESIAAPTPAAQQIASAQPSVSCLEHLHHFDAVLEKDGIGWEAQVTVTAIPLAAIGLAAQATSWRR